MEQKVIKAFGLTIHNPHVTNARLFRGDKCTVTTGLLPDLRRVHIMEYEAKPGKAYVEIISGNYLSSSYWIKTDDIIESNEDAEYGHEWNLYGDDVERTMYAPHPPLLKWRTVAQWKQATDGRVVILYRRYPLIDAARIEVQ